MAKKKNFLEELLINPNNKAPAAKHVQAKKKQKKLIEEMLKGL